MRLELSRYVTPLTPPELPAVLAGDRVPPLEIAGSTTDFTDVSAVIGALIEKERGADATRRSHWDAELVEPLHQALNGIPRRVAVDMQFWHWLCTAPAFMREYVWYRWHGSVPADPTLAEAPGLAAHFLGRPSLVGFSRNAFARLYWAAETLYTEDDGYDLARRVLTNTDLYSGVFERKLALHPPTAQLCVRQLDAPDVDHRPALLRLNHFATTLVIECATTQQLSTALGVP